MNSAQRYRHLPVVDSAPGEGVDKSIPSARAALVKKALNAIYGEEIVLQNIVYYTALLQLDLQTFIEQVAVERTALDRSMRIERDMLRARAESEQAQIRAQQERDGP